MNMAHWLFQANPGRYDLLSVLKRGEPVEAWSISRHRAEIGPDDDAVMWIGGPHAGVYAIGRVSDIPYDGESGDDWEREEDRRQPMTFVPLKLDESFPDAPVLKRDLIQDERFAAARIITQPQAGNPFRLSDAEWDAIREAHDSPVTSQPRGRNPNWAQDELILALDLYFREGLLDDTDPFVVELSELLNRLPIHTVRPDVERFRNPNGVALKLANFAALDPAYQGRGMSAVGRHDIEVFDRFRDDRAGLQRLAGEIRQGAVSPHGFPVTPEEDEEGVEEGRLLYRQHRTYERDHGLVKRKKADTARRGAPLACEVCGFDFEQAWGDLGRDFIECHHRVPLSQGGPTTTKLSDLALVCPNCHRMLHRRQPWPSVEELAAIRSGHEVAPLHPA
jgi:5-methylcytosine-specific restriction protein A